MFLLDGKPLSLDRAFTDINGIQRPANWLRLASPEERLAAGVTEAPDPPVWDQRFAWGYDEQGELIWKDHAELVAQWVSTTRTTANTLLQPTDWLVIREADNGSPADPAVKQWREAIRLACGEKILAIEATADTAELAAYLTGTDYPTWPSQDPAPAPTDPVV